MGMIKIRRYKKLSPRMFELLHEKFTFLEGGMRDALYSHKECIMFVAFDDKKVVGWSMVHAGWFQEDDSIYSVSVYVDKENRHKKIGTMLRKKAEAWTAKRNLTAFWFDAKCEWAPIFVVSEQNRETRGSLDAERNETTKQPTSDYDWRGSGWR